MYSFGPDGAELTALYHEQEKEASAACRNIYSGVQVSVVYRPALTGEFR